MTCTVFIKFFDFMIYLMPTNIFIKNKKTGKNMAQQQMTEEQIKALQEKLKNMSPEELKEFQKKQCIFCQIIAGKVQSRKIYEDETVIAILDVNPANPGHMLIMPKEHYSIMPQIPEEALSQIFAACKLLSNAALRALEVQGSNIIVANGVAAGQRAQHFMAHLIPRTGNDGLTFALPQTAISEAELEKISSILAKGLGAKIEERKKPDIIPLPERKTESKEKSFGKKEHPKHGTLERAESKIKKDDKAPNLDDIANLLGKGEK